MKPQSSQPKRHRPSFAPLLQRGVDGNQTFRRDNLLVNVFAPLLQRGVDGNFIFFWLYLHAQAFAPLLQRGVDGNQPKDNRS